MPSIEPLLLRGSGWDIVLRILSNWVMVSRAERIGKQEYLHHWTPCCCETKDEETGKANHSCSSTLSVLRVIAVEREVADGRKDEEADEHPD